MEEPLSGIKSTSNVEIAFEIQIKENPTISSAIKQDRLEKRLKLTDDL